MKRWMWVAGFVVSGAMIYLLVATRRVDTRAAGARPPAAVVAQAATAPPRATPAPRAVPIEPAQPDDTPEEHAAPEAPSTEVMRDRLERSFAADHSPATLELERDIERAVRSTLPASSSLRSLACRSSLCRVETVHPGLADYRAFADRAFFAYEPAIRQGPVFAVPVDEPTAGQPVVAVAFIARPGSMLPLH